MGTLVSNVLIDGEWYGPAHGNAEDVPAEIVEKITNPKAWADGELPTEAPSPVVEVPVTALDDDGLAEWLAAQTADAVTSAVDAVIADEQLEVDDKVTFVERVATVEAAGKDRKGVAEHFEKVVETLTAPPAGD